MMTPSTLRGALVVLALPAAGQIVPADSVPRGMVVGAVLDAVSGVPLTGAVVLLEMSNGVMVAGSGSSLWQTGRAVRTDEAGMYRFRGLGSGRYRMLVRRIGYYPATIELDLATAGLLRVSVGLTVHPVLLRPDTVEAVRRPFVRTASRLADEGPFRRAVELDRQERFVSTDARFLTASDLVDAVTLGETDLLRALHQFPGVATRDDYTAELWTRGAPWSHTRVLFDGVPLFNPVHTAGVFSGLHPEAIGSVAFHPGARPAALGEGVAGVLDITSRRGGPGLHGAADISPVSARAGIEGGGSRLGWMVAGRRSYVDLLTKAFADSADAIPYAFHDLVGRVDLLLGSDAGLEASGLWERDALRGSVPDLLLGNTGHWGNAAGQVAARVRVGGLLLRPMVGASRFDAQIAVEGLRESALGNVVPTSTPTRNRLEWTAVRVTAEPLGPGGVTWSLGTERVWHAQSYVGPFPRPYPVAVLADTLRLAHQLDVVGAWAEVRARRGAWAGQVGLRLDADLHGQIGGPAVSPRVAIRFTPTRGTHVSAAWSHAVQFTQTLAPAGPSIGPDLHLSDVWLLAGDSIPAVRADIATVGFEGWIAEAWLLQVHVFHRRAVDVAVPDPRPGPVVATRPVFVAGVNTARGLELGVRRMVGRWTMSAAHTLARSRMTAFGLVYPADQDYRHAFDGTAGLRLLPSLRVGTAVTATGGRPFTRFLLGFIACDTITGGCPLEADTLRAAEALESPNARRTPARVTADLFAEWTHAVGNWRVGVFAQVRNVLNRRNAVTYVGSRTGCTAVAVTGDGLEQRQAGPDVCDEFKRGLPMLPVLGVRVEF